MCFKRIVNALCFFLLLLLIKFEGFAQDTSEVDYESSIKVTAEVDKKEVALNRQVICTVIVEWSGDLKRYQISEIENPIVENFEIIKTSAADRRLIEGGVEKAAKIYDFVLAPKSLGMGYIENVIVKYIDNETGEGQSLITPRLNVKVTEPVPEPGSTSWIIKWIVLAIVFVIALILVVRWQRKKAERKRREAEADKVVPLEEEFLTQLHESIKLNAPEINMNEVFWLISKITRKYLQQKYEIPALESTTEKILEQLSVLNLDQTMMNNIQEILTVSDLAKFAGSDVNRNELYRVHTLFEAILERNLGETRTKDQ